MNKGEFESSGGAIKQYKDMIESLIQIRDGKGYKRDGYKSFDEYLDSRFGLDGADKIHAEIAMYDASTNHEE
ncbi:MAG: hypothetical protein ACYCYO_03770 [Bacilli bacterium]